MTPLPPSLYNYSNELATIEAALEEGVEVPPEKMGELIECLQQKTDAVVGFQNMMEDQVALIEMKVKELNAFKSRLTAKMERFDRYVAGCLEVLGTNILQGKLSSITRRKPLDVVAIFDENQIPLEFIRTKTEPEKAKIKAALKEGIEVPGCALEKSGTISIAYKNSKPLSKKQAEVEND